jgi:hypothetical protein
MHPLSRIGGRGKGPSRQRREGEGGAGGGTLTPAHSHCVGEGAMRRRPERARR